MLALQSMQDNLMKKRSTGEPCYIAGMGPATKNVGGKKLELFLKSKTSGSEENDFGLD